MPRYTPITKRCTACKGKGFRWVRDPDTKRVMREADGARCVRACTRCKESGREPTGMTLETFVGKGRAAQKAVDAIIDEHKEDSQ